MDDYSEELSNELNRWLFERFETTLQGIANLAGMLLGFMGIELTLVLQNSAESPFKWQVSLVFLLSGICLLGAILPTPIFLPNKDKAMNSTEKMDGFRSWLDKLLFGEVKEKQSFLWQMRKKVINRKIWFGLGVLVLALGQDVLLPILSHTK